MRYLIPAGALLLVAFLGQSEGAGEKKGEPSQPWAQVTVGGEIRDLIDLRSKVDVLALLDRDIPVAAVASQWRGPLPQRALEKGTAHIRSMQVGDAAWVVALLDETDKDLDQTLPKLKAPAKGGLRVALSGLLAASKDKDPFVAHAHGWGTIRVVEKGDKDLPEFGEILVAGQAMTGKFETAKGKFTSLAIQNGSSPILVTGKVEQIQEPKGKLFVTGKLLISTQGPLVVEAKWIGIGAPKGKQSGGKNPG
jgi:hypothetical protein